MSVMNGLTRLGERHVWRLPRIIGTGMTKLKKNGDPTKTPTKLMKEALDNALKEAKMELHDLDALIAVPSLSHPHFMEAHHFATKVDLLPKSDLVLRTVDTGGAGPITALLQATKMIKTEHLNKIAIVAADCVASMDNDLFFKRADKGCQDNNNPVSSPVIPRGYNTYTKWQMDYINDKYGANTLRRDHFAMVPVLMSHYAKKHPNSMMYGKIPYSLPDVEHSRPIASHINLLECARRADGGAAIIVASTGYVKEKAKEKPDVDVMILGGAEASGPLYPPTPSSLINQDHFSCESAANLAYEEAQLKCSDIDWFGLYDCFPICFLRAIVSVGLCNRGESGKFIEKYYKKLLENENNGINGLDPNEFPINTHGGLLAFGAPWEVPSIYNILEGVDQICKRAGNRQVNNCRRALVYGNGGIFSHSSVAILSEPVV